MKISQFSQIGKRSNNEDSLGTSAALLTVCDGMGGHNYGERASAFVKEAMLAAFAEPQAIGKMEIQQQLNQVQTDLNMLLEKEPELDKMGTTFTGVFITPDVWYAAHIGDSRIYLFRPSEQKLWHTWDHSLVGELMRTKEITIEAGRFHPMSNRISKAIIAHKDGKPASASIVKIDELKAGDIFLLCSDGVIEAWGDLELVKLFSDDNLNFEQKCEKLAEQCNAKSKDNNTAIIAEIEEGDAFGYGANDELEWTTFAEVEADYQKYVRENEDVKPDVPTPEAPDNSKPKEEIPKQEPPKPKTPQSQFQQASRPAVNYGNNGNKPNRKPLVIIIALLLVAAIGLVMFLKNRKPNVSDPDTQVYEACKTVADYRAYLSQFGTDALHYADAQAFIGNYEADSIQKALVEQSKEDAQAAQNELERREKEAYSACTTIGACDSYLRVYPKGKYVKEVREKKSELEKQARETEAKAKAEAEQNAQAEAKVAEQKAQAEAEKKEDEAYEKCTTIKACEEYLRDYPHGRYRAGVQDKLNQLIEEKKLSVEPQKPETKATENTEPKTQTPTETTGTGNGKGNSTGKLNNLTDEQKGIVNQAVNQKSGLGEGKDNPQMPEPGTNQE